MTRMLITVMVLSAAAQADDPHAHVRAYFQRCERARLSAIAATESEIKSLEADGQRKPETSPKIKAARAELARLKSQPAPVAPLPLPPQKNDIGVFETVTVEGCRGRFVDVQEVIDARNAIIRVWYVPIADEDKPATTAKDPVPLDLWAQGIDTSGMKDHSQAELPQVFELLGNKTFPTDCGTRTLPLVEPIDVERFRGGDEERNRK